MANGGASKVIKGLVIGASIVLAIVLIAVLWNDVVDLFTGAIPDGRDQLAIVVVYLVLSMILAVIFSRIGRYTAYGIMMALGPGLWFLFWRGFPLFGLEPTWVWVETLQTRPMIILAILADILMTAVFVPLEFTEKVRKG